MPGEAEGGCARARAPLVAALCPDVDAIVLSVLSAWMFSTPGVHSCKCKKKRKKK